MNHITLFLTPAEAAAIKEAIVELLQDDCEKLDSRDWLATTHTDTILHLRTRARCLTDVLSRLAQA